MASGSDSVIPPAKRRRTAESCKGCRVKKTRCDGARPRCSPCANKDLVCEYNDNTVPISESTLSDIEARLHKLERQPTIHSPAPSVLSTSWSNAHLGRRVHHPHAQDKELTSDSFADHTTTQFMRDMTQISDTRAHGHLVATSRRSDNHEWPIETDISSMVIPAREVSDCLVNCYESFVYPLFPMLHMPTFRRHYNALWEPERQFESPAAEATFHATLNAVFSLGCLNCDRIEPRLRMRMSDDFYGRARMILPLDALDYPSLGVVHYLLLTAQYLSYTKYSNRFHHVIAVAFRVSQTLGLHKDAESSSDNQLKREMSRRTWHHCLTLERLYNSLFNFEATSLAENSVPLPARIDDEYLLQDGTGYQPEGTPCLIDAFIATIKLFEMLEKAQQINQGGLVKEFRLSDLTRIIQLNEKIDELMNNLPPHLKFEINPNADENQEKVLRLQAEGVNTRVLHLRLVLLRPNVLATARQALLGQRHKTGSSRTEATLQTEVSAICVQTAISAIDLLHANLSSEYRLISSNATFVTLSAATIIVAASLLPELNVDLDNNDGLYAKAITKAFEVLDAHRWQIEGASRAKDQLQNFVETIKEGRTRIFETSRSSRDMPHTVQDEDSQVELGIDSILSDFDFTDPLWTFQMESTIPGFDMTGSF